MVNKNNNVIKANRHAEDLILAAFTLWAWNAFPAARRAWWHVPNELPRVYGEKASGHTRRVTQAKAKGVVKGVVDIHGLFGGQAWVIEQKVEGGEVSEDQEKFMAMFRSQGGLTYVTWTLEETQIRFEELLDKYFLAPKPVDPLVIAYRPLQL
jgi:hypothetical protein